MDWKSRLFWFWLLLPVVTLAQQVEGEVRVGNTQKPESEVHAAIDPGDSSRMMAAVMRRDPFVNQGSLSFSFYATSDFGRTWFQSPFRGEVSGNEPVTGGGDPVVVYDSRGKLHLVWLALTFSPLTQKGKAGIYYAHTEDQGITWDQLSSPIAAGNLTTSPGTTGIVAEDVIVDKPWMAVDRSDGPFRDQLYVTYYELQVSPDTLKSIRCIRKSRNAAGFSNTAVQVNSQTYEELQYATVDVDMDGHVHVLFWATPDDESFGLYHARSTDGGQHFDPEVKVTDLTFPRPESPGVFPSPITGLSRLYPSPHLGIDQSDGPFRNRLYAVWMAQGTGGTPTAGFDIYCSHSSDGGQSWSNPIIVNDDSDPSTHQFLPVIEVSPAGTVIISWYDQRADPTGSLTHYYLACSEDGGQSFDRQFSLSSMPSDFSDIGRQNDGFGVGEYTQVVSTPSYAVPFWADGRGNNGEVKVFTGRVSIREVVVTSLEEWQQIDSPVQMEPIYPNPANDYVELKWSNSLPVPARISLTDYFGTVIRKWPEEKLEPGIHHKRLILSGVPSGTYKLVFDYGSDYLVRKLVIVR